MSNGWKDGWIEGIREKYCIYGYIYMYMIGKK